MARKPKDPNAPKKERRSVSVPMPPVLRDAVKADIAKNTPEGGTPKTAGVFVRDLLAQHYGVTLPAAQTRSQYSSPEEKKAAQKQRRAAKADLIKKLLAEHNAKLQGQNGASADGATGEAAPAPEGEAVPA